MRAKSAATKALLLGLLPAASLVNAHTWIEQLTVIAPNGTMVGQPGFPRGNVQRTSPQFKDTAMVHLIPPNGGPPNKIDANQLMCRPEQTTQSQASPDNPRLKAAPGQAVALRYQENGHVTLPSNTPGKPEGSGANFVYLTTDSKPDDKFLQIHRQWTPDGKGGDGRGRLISTQNFDDGQCYQVNDKQISKQRQTEFQHTADRYQGMDLWCQQDIQIPEDAQPGSKITLYWVWDWPTLPGTPGFPEGKQEIYTTCMDIDIVAPGPGQSKAAAKGFVKQDIAKAAVSSQFADIANPTAIKAQTIPFSGINAATNSNAPSSTTRTIPSISTNKNTVIPTQINTSTSAIPTTASPNQVTVTVKETVTATVTPTRSRKGNRTTTTPDTEPTVAAVTETDFVTVTVTRQAQNTAQTFAPVAVQSDDDDSTTTTHSTSSTVNSSAKCSKTERPFLLRARNPFYIVPSQDRPGTNTTPGATGSAGTTTTTASAGSAC